MVRALREFRIRGVVTNLAFLENLLGHPAFRHGEYTTRFIDDTEELFKMPTRRDRASRLLRFIGDVVVNGNEEVKGRARPGQPQRPMPVDVRGMEPAAGTRQLLEAEGPEGVAAWMKRQRKLLITDTTMRDAHQSLLATRVRTDDLVKVAPAYGALLPELFSVECWGGATFDVAMRFLREDPWERLERLRAAMPNLLLQMLLRASNGVGYTNYPDNAVAYFIDRAAEAGVDVFRIFDSLNWVDNMRVSIDAVLRTGKLCEAAICYTGNILDPDRPKYDLGYYIDMARQLEAAGAHVLGIKDMAGLLTPEAASLLVSTLRQEVALPIHFHTHDTSGIAAASVLAAAEAGVDAVDAALDSMSGLTSQPNLGSIATALRHTPRDPGLDGGAIRRLSDYWEKVRANYVGFESDIRTGTSDVYRHEMPGGQYTNLRQQARSLGIENRWAEVSRAYAEVNLMFGDIVKVTPSSKVVGDMALMMVTNGLSHDDVLDPGREIAFPESVVSFFRGELGQPVGGFPEELQRKVLKGAEPITDRPGSVMEPADLEAERIAAERKTGRVVSDRALASYLMYPEVTVDYVRHEREFGTVGALPTATFLYGMEPGEEIAVDIERGKTLIIQFRAVSEPDEEGVCTVFFELNGQPRTVKVVDRSRATAKAAHPKADSGNPNHVGSPMPGLVIGVAVSEGQSVARGDVLMSIEAMKMETAVLAERDGLIERIVTPIGTHVDAKDLLVVMD